MMMMNLERSTSACFLPRLGLFLAALLISASVARAAEDSHHNAEPKVDAQIYYSEKDPHFADAMKVVDELEKTQPALRLERINIDTASGADKLAEDEKQHNITNKGDLTFVFGPYYLTSKGERRDVELYMGPMVARLLHPELGKGRLPTDIGAYVKEIFGPTAVQESLKQDNNDIRYYRIYKDGHQAGYAVDCYHPIGCPICGDVQFLMAVDMKFTAIDMRPVRELERRGRKLDDAESSKFIKQFVRPLPKDDDLKVDGVSGATRTALHYEKAINEIIGELKNQEKKHH